MIIEFDRCKDKKFIINMKIVGSENIDAFDNNISFIASHLINGWIILTTNKKIIIIALIDSPLKKIDLDYRLNVKSGLLSDN